jgi:hypothetical protein
LTQPFRNWEEVAAFALGLADTQASTSYRKPAIKVNGKAFLYIGGEPDSFAISSPLPEKEMLIETDPDSFWESDHYRGWPAILVRYGSVARERIETVITRAWWDGLNKAQRLAFGERP